MIPQETLEEGPIGHAMPEDGQQGKKDDVPLLMQPFHSAQSSWKKLGPKKFGPGIVMLFIVFRSRKAHNSYPS
jgi:hypothetical protein